MMLFVIGAEGLGELIWQDNRIKGYNLPDGQYKKLTAYADDVTFLVTKPEDTNTIMEDINTYCAASGARINKDKTGNQTR